MRPVRSTWLLVFAVFLGTFGMPTQSRAASLAGTVFDQAGKAVPNATVAVKNESTGAVRNLTTDSEGHFSATGLPAGSYSIEASAAGFATSHRAAQQIAESGVQDITIPLSVGSVSETVTVEAVASIAAELAPSGNTLDAISAKSEINGHFIQNFTAPIADFSEVVQLVPGSFSVDQNGIGLGQAKTYFRGFVDTNYTIGFEGIPFQDTNDGSHHSWAFFPSQWLGGADFDRSPGTASTIGPSNFGGSINLLGKDLAHDMDIRASMSYGSFNTRLLDLTFESGDFGKDKKSSLWVDVHQMLSDGYQTYNAQKRVAGAMKYQYRLSDRTTFTAFFGDLDDWNNTPDWGGPLRSQVAQFGDNFLMNDDPTSPFFRGYSFYHIQTDFGYIGMKTDLGGGWKFEDRVFTYRYWNKQNLEKSLTAVSSTSAVDKLNGYNHIGDIATLSKDMRWGTFRTGFWYDWSYTDRYQVTSNPVNWQDLSTPLFHEHYIQNTWQPFVEYELRPTQRLSVTFGVKDAHYNMAFNQYQDNSKVMCLGGTLVGKTKTGTCVGGADFVSHTVGYNSWLPSAAARYRLKNNWSAYAQFGEGTQIPPTTVFDTPNGAVEKPPSETLAKTYQIGSVMKFNRWTLDVDAYYIHYQGSYAFVNDQNNLNEPVYYNVGPSNTKGIEVESNIALTHGLSLYLNGSMGAAKYQTTGLWVANAPKNTEAIGLTWQHRNWDEGIFHRRIGPMYNDNGSLNGAIPIDAFQLTNVFVNYTMRNNSFLRGSKISFSLNNLFDNHNIVAIAPALGPTSTAAFTPNGGDILTLLPGRSAMVTLTVGYAPRR
jgi:iron complex outermembrane receptor protein